MPLPNCCLIFRALAWCIVEPRVDVRSSTCRTSYDFVIRFWFAFCLWALILFTFAQGMINSQSCVSNLRLLAFSLQKFDMSNFSEGISPVVETFSIRPTLPCCRLELRADIEKFDLSNFLSNVPSDQPLWICLSSLFTWLDVPVEKLAVKNSTCRIFCLWRVLVLWLLAALPLYYFLLCLFQHSRRLLSNILLMSKVCVWERCLGLGSKRKGMSSFPLQREKSHWSLEPFNLKRVRLSKKNSTCRIFGR